MSSCLYIRWIEASLSVRYAEEPSLHLRPGHSLCHLAIDSGVGGIVGTALTHDGRGEDATRLFDPPTRRVDASERLVGVVCTEQDKAGEVSKLAPVTPRVCVGHQPASTGERCLGKFRGRSLARWRLSRYPRLNTSIDSRR